MLTAEIIEQVRELAFVPNSTGFSDAVLLSRINMAQRMMVVPALNRAHGEYFTEVLDVTPDAAGFIRLPKDAIVSSARMISWVDTTGRESGPLRKRELADIEGAVTQAAAQGGDLCFSLVPDGVQLYGYPSTGSCRVRFPRMPSSLILQGAVATTWKLSTAPMLAGAVYTATVVPYSGTGVAPDAPGDLTDADTPHRWLGSLAINSDNTVNMAEAVARRAQIGSIVTLSRQTALPQYGDEWHDLLCYFAAAVIAGRRKDYGLKQDLLADCVSIQREILNMADPRTKQNVGIVSAWRGHIRRPSRRF